MEQPLRDEFQYYLENQLELAKKYEGKYIVIKNQQVLGVYDDETSAVSKTIREHELGTFMVQECVSDPNSTVQTFHSRVHG